MKRLIKTFFVLFTVLLAPAIESQSNSDKSKSIVILPSEPPITTTRPHRAPAYIPVSAFYSETLSAVIFNFDIEVDEAEISIESASGEIVTEYFLAPDSTAVIPISGEADFYRISILLNGSASYSGEFELHD